MLKRLRNKKGQEPITMLWIAAFVIGASAFGYHSGHFEGNGSDTSMEACGDAVRCDPVKTGVR